MESILFYFLKSGIWIAAFWMIYHLFLRKETFYRFNRWFLLSGILSSFLLPFWIYRYTLTMTTSVLVTTPVEALPEAGDTGSAFSYWMILPILYFAGVSILLFQRFYGAWKLKRLIAKNGWSMENGSKVVRSADLPTTFSVLNYIFTDIATDASGMEQKMIYEHEQAHIGQYHWVDLIIAHGVCIVQWFNPFAWLYLKAIKQNHEFLADLQVLRNGNSPALYRAALINYTLKAPVFIFSHTFAQFKLNRINMMKKETSSSGKKWTVLAITPLLVVFLWVFAEPEYVFAGNESSGTEVAGTHVFNTLSDINSTAEKDSVKVIVLGKKGSKGKITIDRNGENNEEVTVYVDGEVYHSSLDSIDPEQIQSMSVLKDSLNNKKRVIMISTKESDDDPSEKNGKRVYVTCTTTEVKDTLNGKVHKVSVRQRSDKTPLYVVDGKIFDEGIENIDPVSIESISVIKDTSAVRIYGQDAANGVIIITKKK